MSTPSLQARPFFFEDLNVGDCFDSPTRTITEADIIAFAGLSGDWNAIHTDAEFSKSTMFGERIAHGLLGLSIASGLATRLGFIDGTIIAFMGLEWKFRAVIKIGDTIHVRVQIAETKPVPRLGGGLVTFNVEVLNQRDEVCQKGSWTMLVKLKPAGEAAA